MRFKLFGLAALAAALMALFAAGTASATILESGSGTQYLSGTSLTAQSEGTTTIHPPFGTVECKKSNFGGKTTNSGGTGVTVNANIETFSFGECNAHITVIGKGTISFQWSPGTFNSIIVSLGLELTVQYGPFHCTFKTNNTKIGTLTVAPPRFHIEATLPRVGGTSGAFCGSTAQWTGTYLFTKPSSIVSTG